MKENDSINNIFIRFNESVDSIPLPEKFTFPFYYDPHPLSVLASKQLQHFLLNESNWDHQFGISPEEKGKVIGKMFGVLVVRNEQQELGFLAGFSGKIANSNDHVGFVPPIYDMLKSDGFFNAGMHDIEKLSNQINALKNNPALKEALQNLTETKLKEAAEVEEYREFMRQSKARRKVRRENGRNNLHEAEFSALEDILIRESLQKKHQLRQLIKDSDACVEKAENYYNELKSQLDSLKNKRKNMSNDLQRRIFDEYHFLNANGDSESVWNIFEKTKQNVPPSGAGECAAPKLLHYAFQNKLEPIALAEFWWGASPKSEIRKHGQYYPSCRGKCEPILGHMLKGLNVEDNPMLINPAEGRELKIIHEDEHIIAVNKPAEFLSVPGKTIKDSVYQRIKEMYPTATGPLIVHRLDMSTSGILILAKTKEANKELQKQFIERTIKKRYIALLDGIIEEDSGYINLPLRLDIDDRPRQLVCEEYGKPAQTKWVVIKREGEKTRIHFHPITGRTHQLRVHAAHIDGLNAPILGDDLYGRRSHRLHLHAELIEFKHPATGEQIRLQVDPNF